MSKKKISDEFDVLSEEEIKGSNDLAQALALINQEGCITPKDAYEEKKFIVKKNDNIKGLTKSTLEEKTEDDLEEISEQADSAFMELMDIAVNAIGGKGGCADIASAAQSFLTIKLNAKMAKIENKYKKLNYELQLKKLEATAKKNQPSEDEEDDDIIVVSND